MAAVRGSSCTSVGAKRTTRSALALAVRGPWQVRANSLPMPMKQSRVRLPAGSSRRSQYRFTCPVPEDEGENVADIASIHKLLISIDCSSRCARSSGSLSVDNGEYTASKSQSLNLYAESQKLRFRLWHLAFYNRAVEWGNPALAVFGFKYTHESYASTASR
eukprot:3396249-Pleurochrysis_carterae.AAC.1